MSAVNPNGGAAPIVHHLYSSDEVEDSEESDEEDGDVVPLSYHIREDANFGNFVGMRMTSFWGEWDDVYNTLNTFTYVRSVFDEGNFTFNQGSINFTAELVCDEEFSVNSLGVDFKNLHNHSGQNHCNLKFSIEPIEPRENEDWIAKGLRKYGLECTIITL